MKSAVIIFLLTALHLMAGAQDYPAQILQYREGYKMSLMKGEHALKKEDTGYLRFYAPDPAYRVKATFEQITGTVPFRLHVKNKSGDFGPEVRDYGIVYFNMNGATITMHVYRIITKPVFRVLARDIDKTDENVILFIPFSDQTNYKETFGGGRYLDISAAALQSGNVIIDFNKACNPHTAYEKHYPYIIPPNSLPIEIKAGEKKFGHNPGY